MVSSYKPQVITDIKFATVLVPNLRLFMFHGTLRCNFHAYCLFSLVNTIVYCVPAHWLWESTGFLYQVGIQNVAQEME